MEPRSRAGASPAALLGSLRTTASHTIGVPHLDALLEAVPQGSPFEAYVAAVIDDNVLARPTFQGRKRALRHLRELYYLDEQRPEFRALRMAASDDPHTLPLLAGLLAFTRDELFRASWPAVARTAEGSLVTPQGISDAVAGSGVVGLGQATLAKVGRNVAASWTQTGHLSGRATKRRTKVDARPAAVAYAAFLGHLAGHRGAGLVATAWFDLLDLPPSMRREALDVAHRRGLLDVRSAGDMLEVGVGYLCGEAIP